MISPDFDAEYAANATFLTRYVRRRVGDTPEVDDIVQDAFMRLFVRLREGVDEKWHTRRWLCFITSNLCINEGRRRTRRLKTDAGSIDEAGADDPVMLLKSNEGDPERELDLKTLRERMRIASAALGRQDRLVFSLRLLHDMSHAEVAERMGKSEDAAHNAIRHARTKFAKRYRALEAV